MAKKTPKQPINPAARRSTDAPGSYRGFSVQATRCLHYLMAPTPPEFVWLEVFDDVVVDQADGTRVSEQDKSYTSSNPLSDRAVSLWKTLRNWVDAANSGDIKVGITRFVTRALAASHNCLQTLRTQAE